VKGQKWLKERTDMKYGKDAYCLAVEDHKHAGKRSKLIVDPCKKDDPSQLFLYTKNKYGGSIKFRNPVTGKHQCLDLEGGEDATTGSTVVLNSCKGEEDDNQEWEYLEDYNTFRIPLDVADDTSRFGDLCMGTKRSFDEKLKPDTYEVVAVNCEDGSSEEGDILFTMPPKYELSY